MIALKDNDISFSTTPGWDGTAAGNPFNKDGIKRDKLDFDLAMTAFDFDIVKKPSYDEQGRMIPKTFHLRRTDDDAFIESISVGEQYTPIQHRDVLEYIYNEVMPEVPEMELEMCGTIHGGGVGIVAAKFGDTFAVKGDDSSNETRLFFVNRSNNTGRTTLGFTTVRVRCENTLLAATREADASGWKISHTRSAPEVTKRLILGIKEQAVAALEMRKMCQRLGEIGVDGETFRKCLERVYPIKHLPEDSRSFKLLQNVREEVTRQFECGETAQSMTADTAWKMFNSFTYPIFNPAKISAKKDRAEIAYRGMTGGVGEKVRNIFDKVVEVVA